MDDIYRRAEEQCPLCGGWHYSAVELARHLLFRHGEYGDFRPPRTIPNYHGCRGGVAGHPDVIDCWCGYPVHYRNCFGHRTIDAWARHLLDEGGITEHWLKHALLGPDADGT